MRRALRGALLCGSLLCSFACRKSPAAPAVQRTTSGAIAASNLDAQIAGQEALFAREPGSPMTGGALVELLQTRASYFGSVADYDRAEAVAEQVARLSPGPDTHLVLASSRAALHRFVDALAELSAATGADPVRISGMRASILQAQGHPREAVALREEAVHRFANTQSLGSLAAALGALGDSAGAARNFDEAVRVYRDTSPFPLAWIDFQRGLLAEKSGDLTAARAGYSATLARLPAHAQAAAHLASLLSLEGDRARAEILLRPLAALDDPEYAGLLAGISGNAQLRASAAARYEALLARHPEAFADHAARFYLPFDAPRALRWARRNLEVRQTWDAFDLAIEAASAAHEDGCALAAQAARLPDAPVRFAHFSARCAPP